LRLKRAAIIVLDGVGIGACPDQAAYGDVGSDTLGNVARAVGGLRLPNLQRLGLGMCRSIPGLAPGVGPTAAYGVALPASQGKDSTTGHWEICGGLLSKPFRTYPQGFPRELLDEFARRTGRGWLGNKAASGTQIIAELGEEHQRTGKWIIYTSADSVFQVAAHEGTVPLEELYRACAAARDMLVGEHAVSRVIARALEQTGTSFIFVNVIEFDQSWGHRNDVAGFHEGLRELDAWIPRLEARVTGDDLIILTADHGNDPTTPSTDHSREAVPVLALGPRVKPMGLGERRTFADLGATIAEYFGVASPAGTSFLSEIRA